MDITVKYLENADVDGITEVMDQIENANSCSRMIYKVLIERCEELNEPELLDKAVILAQLAGVDVENHDGEIVFNDFEDFSYGFDDEDNEY